MNEDQILSILTAAVEEAQKLRAAAPVLLSGSDAATVLDILIDVRQRVDRVEELTANAIRLLGACRQMHTDQKNETDDAWDEALVKQRKRTIGFNDEYAAAKERYALANMDVLDLRQLERATKTTADQAQTAVDVLKIILRGLNDVRQDLIAILRNIQFETTLDR